MKQRSRFFIVCLGMIVVLFITACKAENSQELPTQAIPQKEIVDTAQAQSTATSAPQDDPLLVSSLSQVRKAVIQIEAEGTLINAGIGEHVDLGRIGSGVIIDPQGIAVTNHHLIGGVDGFHLWVGGDSGQIYQAKVLGVSECADLAVIDIDGEDFPYVQWYEGTIQADQLVYAAGFALGDAQFALLEGYISNSNATEAGNTAWLSLDAVLGHTARITPGNSGGALIDENAKLLGINDLSQDQGSENIAISGEAARSIIEQLRQGNNLDWIGINGVAVSGLVNEQAISGIWVRSVASESPAQQAGLRAGDIIYELDGALMATDGTMKSYCELLRNHQAENPLAISVIRTVDFSLWEGQIYGNPLVSIGNFVSQAGGEVRLSPNCEPSGTDGFLTCFDNTGTLIIDIPVDWQDFKGSAWVYGDNAVGVAITASTDLAEYSWNKNVPGLFFGASTKFAQWGGYVQFLDIYTPWYHEACVFEGREDYNDGLYRGKVDYFSNCDGIGGNAYVLAAVPIDAPSSAMIIISIQLPSEEEDVLSHIWHSFYLGDL